MQLSPSCYGSFALKVSEECAGYCSIVHLNIIDSYLYELVCSLLLSPMMLCTGANTLQE